MLRKENRATTAQVRETIRTGVSKHSKNFSMRVRTSPHPIPKVNVVISKKVASTAVLRNLLKRRIKNILRSVELPAHKHTVIYAKKDVPQLTPTEIKEELQVLLR